MIIYVEGVDLTYENEISLFAKDLIKSLIELSYDLTDNKDYADFVINFKDFPQKVVVRSGKRTRIIYHTHRNKNFIYPGISLEQEISTFKTLYELKENRKIIVFESFNDSLLEIFKNEICVVLDSTQKCKHKNVYFIQNFDQKNRKMLFCISDLFISDSLYVDRLCAEALSQGCSIYNKLLINKIPDSFITSDFEKIKKFNNLPEFLSITKTAGHYDLLMKRMYNIR